MIYGINLVRPFTTVGKQYNLLTWLIDFSIRFHFFFFFFKNTAEHNFFSPGYQQVQRQLMTNIYSIFIRILGKFWTHFTPMFNVRKPKVGVKWVKLNSQVQYNKNIHRKKDTKNSSLLLPKKHTTKQLQQLLFSQVLQ